VTSTQTFIPAAANARARSTGRFKIGFGTRFFVALLIGLVWVVPSAWSPRLIDGTFIWDGLFLLLWLQDLLRLPKPGELELQRVWHAPPSLGVRSKVSIELHNFGRRPIFARVTDETPRSLCPRSVATCRLENSMCVTRAPCAWPSAGLWRKRR
jgi:hypothetical protein